jgi:cellobiose phosphorylase
MYQFLLGSLIGLERKAELLSFRPCFPSSWPSIHLTYRYGRSVYRITVFQSSGGADSRWTMDEQRGDGNIVRLIDDGQNHIVEMHIGIQKNINQTQQTWQAQ